MAIEESHGNTRAINDHDRGTSYGLLQVHEPDWPELAASTRSMIHQPHMTDFSRAVAEIRLVKPILEDASRQAVAASEVLTRRGYTVGPVDLLLLIDAAWQGPGIVAWAERTSSGVIDEIRAGTAPGRTQAIREHLAELGVAENPSWGKALLVIIGLAGLGGLLALALGEWSWDG